MTHHELESERANSINIVLSGWISDAREDLPYGFAQDLATAASHHEAAKDVATDDARLRELSARVENQIAAGLSFAHSRAMRDLQQFAGIDADMPDSTSMSSVAIRAAAAKKLDAWTRSPAAIKDADRNWLLEQLTARR